MDNTVRAEVRNPYLEDYGPETDPAIVKLLQAAKRTSEFKAYRDIVYRMDYLELPESLKMIGVTNQNFEEMFGNIDYYHKNCIDKIPNVKSPYAEIGFGVGHEGVEGFIYVFGVQTDSLKEVPDGLVGIETNCSKYAVITFGADSAYELVGDEEPGEAMQTAYAYVQEEWLPEHQDIVMKIADHPGFMVEMNGETYFSGMFEVYHKDIQKDTYMQFYIPLKEIPE